MKKYIKNFDQAKLEEAFKIKEAYSNGEISLELANAQVKAHVGHLTPAELAYIEQHFQEEVDDECIKEDLHKMLAIYEGVLINESESLPHGHPIKNYINENTEIKKLLLEIDALFEGNCTKNDWSKKFEKLNAYKIHLSRKQNQLYSELEKKGFDRPTTTMWLYDNEIRDRISRLNEKIKEPFDFKDLQKDYEEFKEYILDLMDKEETILYPTSLELLDDQIFLNMIDGDKEIGYCLIEPSENYKTSFKVKENLNKSDKTPNIDDFKSDLMEVLSKHKLGQTWSDDSPMDVKQGRLSLNQINLVFQHLPVDISYVDENDLVAFYSDTKHRVFPRSKGIIGRNVKNCHPADSVETVQEIISKFRSGEQDRVEFWINKPQMFIYIVYLAVRDQDGKFKGVLEMMQDCTRIRGLEGSKTLLDWEQTKEEEKINKENLDEDKPLENDSKLENLQAKTKVLTANTKVLKIFNEYPGLKEYMVAKSDKFAIMNSPMFKIMADKATVGMLAERSGYSIEKLQEEFTKYIKGLE